ncbi:ornithine decarboxylase-like [Anneissia japonica]|uniref:ornithine decarboxylase-like n=1 Tax=Anneissia japonica TaxID=1529436 RepID=UPI001425A219|nr:ornithine decarboxylase-like [Anneissia japonica]
MDLITASFSIKTHDSQKTIRKIVDEKVHDHEDREDQDDPFFISDLGDIVQKHSRWKTLLPRVEPHYAVKCNPDPAVLTTLAALGTGFDCASKAEIQTMLELSVSPSRIIFANPCKQKSHLKYACDTNVSLMTFDNEDELYKVKRLYPGARLVLRILTDDTTAQCQLGLKYGCHPKHARYLLQVAKQLDLNVVGVSFHVGSGCRESSAYTKAIASSHDVFEAAHYIGYHMDLLDIGGGFPGQPSAPIAFEEFAEVINRALDEYFPVSCGVRVIAEPGRYFVASAFTLAVNVTAKRVVARDIKTFEVPESKDLVSNTVAPTKCEEPAYMYYVNDGVYGSFNCLLYDHASVEPTIMTDHSGEMEYSTSIWGPSCDGLDRIIEHTTMPELEVGEWILFKDMGAYTMCAGSEFNGFKRPVVYYVLPNNLRVPMHQMLQQENKEFKISTSNTKCTNYRGYFIEDAVGFAFEDADLFSHHPPSIDIRA